MLTELDIAYPESPLSVTASQAPHGGDLPKAGERWRTSASDQTPIGAGDTPRFAVFASAGAAAALTARFAKLLEVANPACGRGRWTLDRSAGRLCRSCRAQRRRCRRAGLPGGDRPVIELSRSGGWKRARTTIDRAAVPRN